MKPEKGATYPTSGESLGAQEGYLGVLFDQLCSG